MSEQISIADFYERTMPEQFEAAMADAPSDVVDQPELTATYEIEGEGGGIYGLRIAQGKLEVVPGGIEHSDLYTTIDINNWRLGTIHAREPVINYYTRGKANAVKGLKGALKLDIDRESAPNYESTTVFGGAASPEVTLRMSAENYRAMAEGRLNGQMAFMTGKLKFQGSLPLLMQLAALNF